MFSIGVDIGGTFTDFTAYDRSSGKVFLEKVLSTPATPETAVLEGLEILAKRVSGLFAKCDRFNHATTLVTNSIIERKGPKIALLTTSGFRDVLEIRREVRYNVYDLFAKFPDPLVPRHLRFPVRERVLADGSISIPLDQAGLDAIIDRLGAEGVEAVAICFLHSYKNPEHERQVREHIRRRLPNVAISLSHEVSPEPREYDRFSTTVLDAFVKPIVNDYLALLASELSKRGVSAQLEVMLSNGGSTTGEAARSFPIQLIESGPAAGVEAAIWMCRKIDLPDALSFDMGGTTAKLCVIRDFAASRSRKFEAARVHRFVAGSGMPVSVPVYDLVEIGAGGGSIARLDKLGLISVGPDSAGAVPGPACYGRDGKEPTVTDADLLLGLLDPEAFLGGEMALDRSAAEAAMLNSIGAPLSLSAVEAAFGVFDIVNETMAAAARLHIAEKGADPTKLSIIAFGGAGPLHALEIARKLGCPRVVFPPLAGVMSSFGLLTGPAAFERLQNVKRVIDTVTPNELLRAVDKMADEIVGVLGGDKKEFEFSCAAEMWYRGQDYPIEVSFTLDDLKSDNLSFLADRFRQRYLELYGRADDDMPLEITTIRSVGRRKGKNADSLSLEFREDRSRGRVRRVYDPTRKKFVEAPVIDRASLKSGDEAPGPLVVQERETGVVIRAGDRLKVHPSGALIVEIGTEA